MVSSLHDDILKGGRHEEVSVSVSWLLPVWMDQCVFIQARQQNEQKKDGLVASVDSKTPK